MERITVDPMKGVSRGTLVGFSKVLSEELPILLEVLFLQINRDEFLDELLKKFLLEFPEKSREEFLL